MEGGFIRTDELLHRTPYTKEHEKLRYSIVPASLAIEHSKKSATETLNGQDRTAAWQLLYRHTLRFSYFGMRRL